MMFSSFSTYGNNIKLFNQGSHLK